MISAESRTFRFYLARPFDSVRLKPETKKVQITLNGEPFQIERPLSVVALLEQLDIDARRVAVEHNLTIIKRHTFTTVVVGEGDRLEIVNAVGGG